MEESKIPEDQEHQIIQTPSSSSPEESKASALFSGLRKSLSTGVEKGKEAALRGKQIYQKSEVKHTVDRASEDTKQFLEERRVLEKASKAYEATQEHLDKISGAKLHKLVEERMVLQNQYNAILATKLHEALSRIEALEQQLSKSDLK